MVARQIRICRATCLGDQRVYVHLGGRMRSLEDPGLDIIGQNGRMINQFCGKASLGNVGTGGEPERNTHPARGAGRKRI